MGMKDIFVTKLFAENYTRYWKWLKVIESDWNIEKKISNVD